MTPFFIVQEFESYLQFERRLSVHTVRAYVRDLDQFFLFHNLPLDYKSLEELSHHMVRSWVVSLLESGVEKISVNRKVSSLRTFFTWAQKMSYVSTSPMSKLKSMKVEKRLPQFAKEGELSDINSLFGDDFSGVRDRLVFELLYQTGIRLSELIGLKELDVTSSHIKVHGKRDKERLVPIGGSLYSLIEVYREKKRFAGLDGEYLLVLDSGHKLYEKFVYRKINNYLGVITNLEKKSPHVLRHTFATHMLNEGSGLEILKDILGHASLAATQVYTHNSFSKLKTIYSQAHPRGAKKD